MSSTILYSSGVDIEVKGEGCTIATCEDKGEVETVAQHRI